jgi:hypothetical protein
MLHALATLTAKHFWQEKKAKIQRLACLYKKIKECSVIPFELTYLLILMQENLPLYL